MRSSNVKLQVDRCTDVTWDVTYIIWAEYSVCDIPCDTALLCDMIGMSIGIRISHGMSHISYGLSTRYRVAWSHRMPYNHRSFPAKEPYNQWLFCKKMTCNLRHSMSLGHPVCDIPCDIIFSVSSMKRRHIGRQDLRLPKYAYIYFKSALRFAELQKYIYINIRQELKLPKYVNFGQECRTFGGESQTFDRKKGSLYLQAIFDRD